MGGLGSLLGRLWPVLSCLGSCFVELIRCSRPRVCFVELIRCSRSWVCFVELIRRFPFSAAQVTESDFRRLEVALSSLGIYYYEVVSPGSARAGVPQVSSPAWASFSLIFIDFP